MSAKNIYLFGLGGLLLVAMTAGASAYVATNIAKEDTVKTKTVSKSSGGEKITWNEPRQTQPAAPARTACDDGNVVGAVVGGVGGGVVGSQIGKGSGKTAGTIAGTLGGAYLGRELIPTQNVTCAR